MNERHVEPNFKKGLPKKSRNPGSMGRWRKEVLRRSKYRCAICKAWDTPPGNSLAAHHVIFRSHCAPEHHDDPANGVALCHECHRSLHNGDVKLAMASLRPDTIDLCHTLGLRWTQEGPEGTLSKYFK